MFPGTLDDIYLPWLYSQVDTVKMRRDSRTYWKLLKHLHTLEFTWTIDGDAHRADDGKQLRYEWAQQSGIELDPDWMGLECSFLEMLIGVSRRMEFLSDAPAAMWFWRIIGNLGLRMQNDILARSMTYVTTRVREVMDRRYSADGQGGIFPMENPERDQRYVEIWYQMQEYLLREE